MGISPHAELRDYPHIRHCGERFDRGVVDGRVRMHHQEDLAQALGLDWRDTDVKFQEPNWPTDPKRASVVRIAELLGSISAGDEAIEAWLRQLTFDVVIGNNDAHAKNVALLHLPGGTRLSPIYDAVPNLFQDGLISWNRSLAVGGVFDHRRISVERLLEEARSWAVVSRTRAELIVSETLAALAGAIDIVKSRQSAWMFKNPYSIEFCTSIHCLLGGWQWPGCRSASHLVPVGVAACRLVRGVVTPEEPHPLDTDLARGSTRVNAASPWVREAEARVARCPLGQR